MFGEHDVLYRRRRVVKVDFVWPRSGLRMILVQIESRINLCSFYIPRLQESHVVIGSKDTFYYGLGSWFPLKPGRDLFRNASFPVDACTITLDQTERADADAII